MALSPAQFRGMHVCLSSSLRLIWRQHHRHSSDRTAVPSHLLHSAVLAATAEVAALLASKWEAVVGSSYRLAVAVVRMVKERLEVAMMMTIAGSATVSAYRACPKVSLLDWISRMTSGLTAAARCRHKHGKSDVRGSPGSCDPDALHQCLVLWTDRDDGVVLDK